MVAYNKKKYYIDIIEAKPSNAISIFETDCEVDFAPPLDYKEPEKPAASVPSNKAQSGQILKALVPYRKFLLFELLSFRCCISLCILFIVKSC